MKKELMEKLIQRIDLGTARKWRNTVTDKWLKAEIHEYEKWILSFYSEKPYTEETQQDMKDRLEEEIEKRQTRTELDEKAFSTLNLLYHCDYVINDKIAVEFLLAHTGLEKCYFSFGIDGAVHAVLKKHVPEIGIEKEEFYKKSYNRAQYAFPIFKEKEVFAS